MTLFPSFFYQGTNLYLSFSFLPAAGPSLSSLKGMLKRVSWLFFLLCKMFSHWCPVCVSRNGIILQFCGAPLSVCFRLAWTPALGSRWVEQWGARARWPGWPSPALFVTYSTKTASLGKSCLDLRGGTGNLSINTSQRSFMASRFHAVGQFLGSALSWVRRLVWEWGEKQCLPGNMLSLVLSWWYDKSLKKLYTWQQTRQIYLGGGREQKREAKLWRRLSRL